MAGFVRFVLFVLVGALVVGTAQGIHPVLVSISGEVLPPFVVFGRRIDAGGHLANAMAVVLPMAGALLIEWLSTGGRYSSLSAMLRLRDRSARRDLLFVVLAMAPFALPLLSNLLTFGFVGFATGWVRSVAPAGLNLFDSSVERFGWVGTTVLYYLSVSLFDYLRHRLLHSPVAWPLHRMHHRATVLTPATTICDHPGGALLSPLAYTLPALLWAPPPMFAHLFLVAYAYYAMFAHTQADIEWGWIGRHVFPAPVAHKLHHSIASEHINCNYCSSLLLWDRVFGTFRYAPHVPQVGIAGHEGRRWPLATELLGDLRDFLRSLLRLPRPRGPMDVRSA